MLWAKDDRQGVLQDVWVSGSSNSSDDYDDSVNGEEEVHYESYDDDEDKGKEISTYMCNPHTPAHPSPRSPPHSHDLEVNGASDYRRQSRGCATVSWCIFLFCVDA